MCNKGGEVILVTEPEIIAVDEQQKLMKIGDKTLHLTWNKYTQCWEAEIFIQKQDRYGRFVNEYHTSVTGNSEQETIQNAIELSINP
tara:strand:+ start:547 stop:807 length:261 start_codon:yes stop_codon:yes gene_type:complete